MIRFACLLFLGENKSVFKSIVLSSVALCSLWCFASCESSDNDPAPADSTTEIQTSADGDVSIDVLIANDVSPIDTTSPELPDDTGPADPEDTGSSDTTTTTPPTGCDSCGPGFDCIDDVCVCGPSPHYKISDGACLPSCGAAKGAMGWSGVQCCNEGCIETSQGSVSAWDCPYCCEGKNSCLEWDTPVTPIDDWPNYPSNPYVITLEQPVQPGEIRGSLFVHELNGDGLMDFVVTGPNVVGAYDHMGGLLWKTDNAINLPGAANSGSGYPGTHAPGAIAGDMDGDGDQEVAYLTTSGKLRIRDGASGTLEKTYNFPGAQALTIANLRGKGDRDAVLQYSQTELRAVNLENGKTLWHKTDWHGLEHSQVRTSDMDGDGLDEVIGPVFLNDKGVKISNWNLKKDYGTSLGGLDSIAIGDVVPGGCLEIALAEQGGNNATVLANRAQVYWSKKQKPSNILPTGQCKTEKDPDKVTVGEFDTSLPGLETFARSACSHHPWVHDAQGNIIASWNLKDTAPAGWLTYDGSKEYGIEEIRAIDWTGGDQRHLLLKERHTEGKAAIVDAMTGNFLKVFNVSTARSYASDIAGDSREEVIILSSSANKGQIKIFWNDAANSQDKPRPWDVQYYRRSQQNWNYYSPSAGSPSLTGGMSAGKTCEEPKPICGDGKCAPGAEDCGKCPGDCPCPSGKSCQNNQCKSETSTPPNPSGAPALPADFAGVVWLHKNVSGWSKTATLSSVTFKGDNICLNYNKSGVWPGVVINVEKNTIVNGNPWIFVYQAGTWYAATWEWLRVNQTCKASTSVAGDHIKKNPLKNFTPVPGQTYYFMVSGLARNYATFKNVDERSNVVKVVWPGGP